MYEHSKLFVKIMIFFPECSLTYVEVEEADRLTRWLAQTFPQLLLVDYEQINPGDTFDEDDEVVGTRLGLVRMII